MMANIIWGIGWGFRFAVVFSAVAAGQYVLSGSEPFDRIGLPFMGVLVVYVLSALIGGTALGCVRPLTKSRAGAVVAGVIAMTPATFVGGLALFGPPTMWDTDILIGLIVSTFIAGAGGGYLYWSPPAEVTRATDAR